VDVADAQSLPCPSISFASTKAVRRPMLSTTPSARAFVVIVTPEKLVDKLGAFGTPVEVVPFTLVVVKRAIEAAYPAVHVQRRGGDATPFVTDNGNAILDCAFGAIDDPAALDAMLRNIHGVVATGLFPSSITAAVLVADADGVVRELPRPI
jgi:ribose 5-phosphate isomerase A